MLKKLLAALGTLALVLGIVALVAGPASAHNHTVSASCDAGVTVSLTSYAGDDQHPTSNHVTVWIDNQSTPVADLAFGGTFEKTYTFSTSQASHSYRVKVTAYDDSQYSFDTGVQTLTGCETEITPAAATSTNPYCTAAGAVGGGGYTIPAAQTGVQYQLWDGSQWGNISAGVYPANPGAVIKIQAVATTGYKLKVGSTTSWTFTLTNPDASTCVVPTPPTANPAECITAAPGTATNATYTVPEAPAGYSYFVNGSTKATSDVTVDVITFPTTIVIVAKVTSGYTFPNNTVTTWTFIFASPGDCHATVTPAAVVPQQASCTAPGVSSDNGFTITATPGVIYHLSTSATPLAAGFHSLGSGAGSVEIQATAATHYVLTGTVDWKFTFLAATDCLVKTLAGDPKFHDASCDATQPGVIPLGTYQVLVADHVHYEASVNGKPFTTLVALTLYSAQPGDVVVIQAIVDQGYVISPAILNENLTHTFAAIAGDCLVKADFVKPAATSQSCVVTGTADSLSAAAAASLASGVTHTLTQAFITIPNTPHVQYFINDVLQTNPGDVILKPGTYKVSAVAETGYFLQGYNGPWDEVLTSAEPCGDLITHPLVDPSAVQVQMGCFTNGSYALSNDLSDSAALTWTVNGSTVSEGKYQVSAAGVVTVHVVANGPAYGLETGATTDWTFHFVRPTSCDLTTLALTGSTPTGWIIFGYAMLVSGLALLALRFARRRDEQA